MPVSANGLGISLGFTMFLVIRCTFIRHKGRQYKLVKKETDRDRRQTVVNSQ